MAKQLMYSEDARRKMQRGLDLLADAVKVTLGPTGWHVALEKSWGAPKVTKDGVTVSKDIELPDPFENMGAKLVNEVASKTSDEVGDGTTTATVLAQSIISEGLKNVAAGCDPMALRRGINRATAAAVEELRSLSKPVKKREDICQVATISANNDAFIGNLLADAMDKVGKDGVIKVEEGKSIETTLDFVEGMQFDKGFISPYFMTNPESREAVLESPYIFIHEKKLSNLQELIPLLEKVARVGASLLIISEDVEGEALATLVVNKLRGVLKCCAVKAPGFGDRRKRMLEDIAILTGGRVISEDLGVKIEAVDLSWMGQAKTVAIDKDNTTIVAGAGKKSDITGRISQIRSQIETTTSDYDGEKLQERLAKLTGGVAVVNVGGTTEIEVKNRKALVDNALNATRAAVEEGIVPGGGVAALRAAPAVLGLRGKVRGDEKVGVEIVARALEEPLRQIAVNTGSDAAIVVDEVRARKGAYGFDANVAEYKNLFEAGIVDPLKVTRTALQSAASMAGLMLSTETLVTDLKEKKGKPGKKIEGSVF